MVVLSGKLTTYLVTTYEVLWQLGKVCGIIADKVNVEVDDP